MSIFTAGPAGVDMSALPSLLDSQVVSSSATTTTVTDVLSNGGSEVFTGNFELTSGQVTGGTETGFALYSEDGKLLFSLSDAAIPATTFTSDVQSGDTFGLVQSMLSGHDTYQGAAGQDYLIGYGDSSTFIGGGGIELFRPAAGDNTIVGGHGINAVLFEGPSADYTITNNSDGSITVTDSLASRNGTDTISNVQLLQFSDKTIFELTPTEAKIALLYKGALGRMPDEAGLMGWANALSHESRHALDSDNFTALAGTAVDGLPDLAFGFTNSAEFRAKYGAMTDTQFVTQLYDNILDRAPDSAGMAGWMNALATGHSREWVLVGFAESAEAIHDAEMGFVGQTGTVHPGWLITT